MPMQEPTIQTMKISDVKAQLSRLVNDIYRGKTRVLIEKSGIPVAALVSANDFERLNRLEEEDREAWAVVEAMRAAFDGVPQDEIEREAAKAVAEVRAKRRAEREAAVKSA